ncbi:hypothetical protein SODALDRAFT_382404 [Sodiomyces alkalinus F11]|uniref:Uncharacterized protein n=1 Tax=Sodiomyces alkalinus (strain CBS 110278 / VKM F-3762 / F11) TaxID=1314773 RepID=A0A3N2PJB1_SODAK|nr:hypothetical protein SODALDRAFT_382404 [Sodiomyces alkalinus F11]ROT34605.1 hypothetical protein SODALDRAFT_382404 [Sodiomyces alkalinus F11]
MPPASTILRITFPSSVLPARTTIAAISTSVKTALLAYPSPASLPARSRTSGGGLNRWSNVTNRAPCFKSSGSASVTMHTLPANTSPCCSTPSKNEPLPALSRVVLLAFAISSATGLALILLVCLLRTSGL